MKRSEEYGKIVNQSCKAAAAMSTDGHAAIQMNLVASNYCIASELAALREQQAEQFERLCAVLEERLQKVTDNA